MCNNHKNASFLLHFVFSKWSERLKNINNIASDFDNFIKISFIFSVYSFLLAVWKWCHAHTILISNSKVFCKYKHICSHIKNWKTICKERNSILSRIFYSTLRLNYRLCDWISQSDSINRLKYVKMRVFTRFFIAWSAFIFIIKLLVCF